MINDLCTYFPIGINAILVEKENSNLYCFFIIGFFLIIYLLRIYINKKDKIKSKKCIYIYTISIIINIFFIILFWEKMNIQNIFNSFLIIYILINIIIIISEIIINRKKK